MSPEIISIVVLVVMFLIATTLPVNLGALALVGAFGVGMLVLGLDAEQVMVGVVDGDEISGGFPGDLFVLLVGLTYLFALATNNGTVDLLVQASLRMVGGRVALIPWVFFFLSTGLSAIGALFAVAIVAPLAMPFARRYGINLLLMGMMVVHGALGGAFSPISVYGAFVNETMVRTGLPSNPAVLFLTPLLINIVIGAVLYTVLGGRSLRGRGVIDTHDADTEAGSGGGVAVATATRLGLEQVVTLLGLLGLAVGAVAGLDVGVLSVTIAVVLRLLATGRPDAVGQISWSTVLLICGVITYVGVLTEAGTISFVSSGITAIGAPLLAALLLCYLGGVLSAFASSVAILGVAIPLAVPFLQTGQVSAVGMVAALAVAATVVDVSPFSTNGALVLANAPADVDRDRFYRQMLGYAGIVVVAGPLLAWAVLVLPGLL